MKKGWMLLLSIIVTFIICTIFVKLRYDIGFRGEQLYMVYPIGGIIWGFIMFVILIISGGTALSDNTDDKQL